MSSRETTAQKIELIKELHRRNAPKSLYYTLQLFWGVIIQDDFVSNWHIPYICQELETLGYNAIKRKPKEHDLIINIPPGTSKSTIVTIMWDVWLWLNDPSMVMINSSYTSGLSIDHSLKFSAIIHSELFNEVFQPYFKEKFGRELTLTKDTEAIISNNFGGSRISTSTGGTVTGKHAHIIKRDDPLDPEQAESEAYRKKANRFNDGTLSSRKKQKESTVTVTVMQRLHENDSTGHDLRKEGKKIKHICLPAEISGLVKPSELKLKYVNGLLDPIRLSPSILNDSRIDLGAYAYGGQFDQNPKPAEGLMYNEFKTYTELPTQGRLDYLNYTDTADTGNDYLCSISYIDTGKLKYVQDIVYTQQAMEATEPKTAALIDSCGTRKARIESNNGGRGFARNVERLIRSNCVVSWFHQSKNKDVRIFVNRHTVSDQIVMPVDWHVRWPVFYRHVTGYMIKGKNDHDDAPDVLTGIVETKTKRGIKSKN
jgi:predicted phage terminase large subunit-like protein